MAKKSSSRSYFGLDLVRLSAALLVAFYHLGFFWWQPAQSNQVELYQGLLPIAPFVSSGWVGVPIFFVISGFVITLSAEGKTASHFIRSRASRLYPAAWVCATITLFVTACPIVNWLGSIVLSPIGPWVSKGYWTLGVEIIFYSLVALTIASNKSGLRTVAVCLGSYSAAFWAAKAVNVLAGRPADALFMLIENYSGYLLLAHYGCHFAIGMLIYQRRFALAAVYACVGFVGVLWQAGALAGGAGPNAAPFFVPPLIWLAAVLVIVASVVWNDQISAWLEPWKQSIRTMGLMTYPLYLVHSELGRELIVRLAFLGPKVAFLFGMATVLAVSRAILPIEQWIRQTVPFQRRQPSDTLPASLP